MRKQGHYIHDKRWKFKDGLQRRFIAIIKKKNGESWKKLACRMNISEYSLKSDMYNEKTTIPQSIVRKLWRIYPFKELEVIKKTWVEKVLCKNWGQKKAGEKSIKKINIPPYSEELAEFIGAIIGDGHISNKGVRVTGNSFEISYHIYIKELIKKLFNLDANIFTPTNKKSVTILNVYSKNLVNFLAKMNLNIGDKIKNKTRIPSWIFHKEIFVYGALRGLIDTDGGIYLKQHKYSRAFIEFQNHCTSTRRDITKLIKRAGFMPSKSSINIRIQNQTEVKKFFEIIGSSNPKNILRYQNFIKTGYIPLKELLNQKVLEYRGPQPFKARL